MKYVLGILLATVLLPKLATGNGSGLLAFYLNHESTEAFRQAAPFFAGAAGLFTFILVIWSRTRPNAPIRAGAIKPPAIIIYTFIAAAAAWMITAKSAPVVLSAFGSPATSQTVLVMKAVGNVPCKSAYAVKRKVHSEWPGFICVPAELDRSIGRLRKGNDRIEIKITGFGNAYGLWYAKFELMPKDGEPPA